MFLTISQHFFFQCSGWDNKLDANRHAKVPRLVALLEPGLDQPPSNCIGHVLFMADFGTIITSRYSTLDLPKLYILRTINTEKELLRTTIWADKNVLVSGRRACTSSNCQPIGLSLVCLDSFWGTWLVHGQSTFICTLALTVIELIKAKSLTIYWVVHGQSTLILTPTHNWYSLICFFIQVH